MTDRHDLSLEPEQRTLLDSLVKAHESLPRNKRQDFKYSPAFIRKGAHSREFLEKAFDEGGSVALLGELIRKKEDLPWNLDHDMIFHPGLPDEHIDTLQNDIDILKLYDLIHFKDDSLFFITPKGFTYSRSMDGIQDIASTVNKGNQPMPTLDVFISHSSHDADIALALIDVLRTGCNIPPDKIRCTSVDGYRLKAGTNTDEQLRVEVRAARFFIGLITPASLQSAYVLFELGARWGAGLHLAPILAAGADTILLKGPLSGLNALNCSNEAQMHQLVNEVALYLEYQLASPAVYSRYLKHLVDASTKAGESQNP